MTKMDKLIYRNQKAKRTKNMKRLYLKTILDLENKRINSFTNMFIKDMIKFLKDTILL
jgi:hypothetical protein